MTDTKPLATNVTIDELLERLAETHHLEQRLKQSISVNAGLRQLVGAYQAQLAAWNTVVLCGTVEYAMPDDDYFTIEAPRKGAWHVYHGETNGELEVTVDSIVMVTGTLEDTWDSEFETVRLYVDAQKVEVLVKIPVERTE